MIDNLNLKNRIKNNWYSIIITIAFLITLLNYIELKNENLNNQTSEYKDDIERTQNENDEFKSENESLESENEELKEYSNGDE
ncbi:MAG: hypothetical protein RI980_437 [Bacteroidota bacterium]|jgi:peptidoglycan hydrolase CwlO-like protein